MTDPLRAAGFQHVKNYARLRRLGDEQIDGFLDGFLAQDHHKVCQVVDVNPELSDQLGNSLVQLTKARKV